MKRQGVSSSHVAASFLGVLVSAGRQMDVWVCVQRSDISLCAEYSPLCTKVHDISQTACPLNASVCSVCRSLCDLYIKKKNQLFRGHIYSLRCPQVSFWGIVTLTLPPWTKLSIAGAVCVCGRLGKKKLSPFPSNLKMDNENARIPGREKYLFTWCRWSYDSEKIFWSAYEWELVLNK